jgi:NADPH:quinone reductase-like Zn-dependent oxidoreductase
MGLLTCETDYKQIGQWMKEGKVKPVVAERYTLEELPKAFEQLKTGRVRGKLVVQISDE